MQPIANRKSQIANGFTLVELLVVIAIIGVLIGLLFPTIAAVQQRAKEADTASLIASLQSACERYAVDFNGAYPGPIGNGPIELATQDPTAFPVVVASADFAATPYVSGANRVTMAENLYLGLMGGLRLQAGVVVYDPSAVGQGPATLNPLAPARRAAYYNANADWSMKDNGGTKSGQFSDLGGSASDTVIPEFVDRFGTPMPILYWRARRSLPAVAGATAANNPVVTLSGTGSAPYDLNQNIAYLNSGIGEGRSLKQADIKGSSATPSLPHGLRSVDPTTTTVDKTTVYPFDAYAYFYDRASGTGAAARAKQKEGFFLISAGRDRVYGTDDDICSSNFGKVGQ
jgi:prepilin-type N-terminal cleavage/methylation domain-containing protein